MGRSRFTEEDIQAILAQYQRGDASIADVCATYDISPATLYRWQAQRAPSGRGRGERLEALERENRQLKHLLAEALLTSAALCDMLDRPQHETDASKGPA